MPDDADRPAEPTFGLQELADRSGLPIRTIRWYQSEGLLPKPDKHGRDAVYRADHLERLGLIAELRDRGLTLNAIRDLVVDGRCSFANLDKLKLSRFAAVGDDWLEARGWPSCRTPGT